ncbi:hypothetical protein B0H10DRAFT_2183605 [Mycena sp. CBHHK59/15]|nr:hypothetical protein B0H10DRAFT_2183605 [Mycena sp. CBHHK59/15]
MTLLGENRFCVTFPKLDVTRHVTRRHRRTRHAPGHISCSPTTFSVMARLSKQQQHLAKAHAQLAEGHATGKENRTPSSLSTCSPPRFSKTALSPHKSKKKHDVADSNYIAELCKENLLLHRREKQHKEQIADLKRKVKMNDKRVNAAVAEVQAATAAARTSAEQAICDAVKTQEELADKLARAQQ